MVYTGERSRDDSLMKGQNPTIALMLWLTAAYAASFAGFMGVAHGYETAFVPLAKPAWMPPVVAFPLAWTVLFALVGVAAWRVSRGEGTRRAALVLWWLQLLLGALWPWLFFGLARLAPAFGVALVLWVVLLATTVLFSKRDALAAWLLFPYLAWVGFSSILSLATWRMNVGPAVSRAVVSPSP